MRLRRFLRVLLVVPLVLLAPAALAQSATSTALAITSGGNAVTTVREGTEVILTATVSLTSGGAAAAPGQVEFCEVEAAPLKCTDIRLLGTEQLLSGGTAVYRFFPGPGTHTYQAVFLGTHVEAASSSSEPTLVVTPFYPTTTTISATGSPGDYTLTATVTSSEGTVPPTGTISFQDTSNANYVLATAPLVGSPPPPAFSFANIPGVATQPGPDEMLAANFTGDGNVDLAVSSLIGGSFISVYLGNGNGTFTPVQNSFTFADYFDGFVAADFTGDGRTDLAVTLNGAVVASSTLVETLLGNGDGTFAAGPMTPDTSGAPFSAFIATGDFNGDGIPDLAISLGSAIAILLGNGDGSFTLRSTAPTGIGPGYMATGDFNNDGNTDLAVVNGENSNTLTILLGNGDGTFTPAPQTPATGVSPLSIVAADFNGDGNLDLAVANTGIETTFGIPDVPGSVTILLGNGDGTFTPTAASPATGNFPYWIAFGDFNGDGKADLVTANENNTDTLSVLLGNGDGTFAPALTLPAAGNPDAVVSRDFNGDGLWDIAASSPGTSSILLFLSQAGPQSATATVTGVSVVGTGTHLVDASYPGDGEYQPSISGTIPLITVLEPTTLTLTANPATSYYGQQVVLTAVVAPDTAQDHNATGTVTFSVGSTVLGTGTVAGGIATLNVTSLPEGSDSVVGAYSGDTNFASSSGTGMETVSGYGSATTLTAAPNPAGLGQTVTLTAAVAGVGYSAVPTGTVAFFDGANQLGTATLNASGQATYATSTLALGTHSLTAVYAGNSIYYASTSAAVAEVIVKPDFSVTLSSPSVTLQTYSHTTTTVTLTSLGDFTDTIGVTCGSLPTFVTCIFTPNPAGLAANGTTSVSFYLDTDSILGGDVRKGTGQAPRTASASPAGLALLLSPFSLFAVGLARRRRKLGRQGSLRLLLLIAAISMPAALALLSCGSQVTPVPSAAPGTYSIPITGTGATSGITHTAQLTLTVTP